jgi:hypothetical protein
VPWQSSEAQPAEAGEAAAVAQRGAGAAARQGPRVRFAAGEPAAAVRQSQRNMRSSDAWCGAGGDKSSSWVRAGGDEDQLDERLLRAQARAEWRQMGMSGVAAEALLLSMEVF